jgi:hypothetical protein
MIRFDSRSRHRARSARPRTRLVAAARVVWSRLPASTVTALAVCLIPAMVLTAALVLAVTAPDTPPAARRPQPGRRMPPSRPLGPSRPCR